MRRFSRSLFCSNGAGRSPHSSLESFFRMATAVLLAGAFLTASALCATPEPPRRPAKSVKPPANDAAPPPQKPAPDNAAPQTPAPAQAAPPARAPIDVDPTKLQPYNLPPASRQRMRLCGERWRDLKMAGKSVGLTWRSFAEKCLPGQD